LEREVYWGSYGYGDEKQTTIDTYRQSSLDDFISDVSHEELKSDGPTLSKTRRKPSLNVMNAGRR
jgi:hypothetical protein